MMVTLGKGNKNEGGHEGLYTRETESHTENKIYNCRVKIVSI